MNSNLLYGTKIICSLEEYDSILDFNRPNGSSKTWYLKEKGAIEYPLMWGEWNVFQEPWKKTGLIQDRQVKDIVCPLHTNQLMEYKDITELGNSSHIYIINAFRPSFFEANKDIGFDCIHPQYIQDIKNGKCKIIICCYNEGYSGMEGNRDFEIIESWRVKAGLPPYSVCYVTANLLGKQIAKDRGLLLEIECIGTFEPCVHFNYMDEEVVDFNPIDEKYLYLSYNRQPRFQRQLFIQELLKLNLIDKGLISIGKIENNNICPELEEETKDFLLNKTPLSLGYDLIPNLACNIHISDYHQTFISIITETLTCPGTLFLSEKTWKPLLVGHPFLTFGNKGTLNYLKSIGYMTFDKWIDESYDDMEDENDRYKALVFELNKFNSKSIDELKQIRQEMKPILTHNQIMFRKMFRNRYDWSNNSLLLLKFFQKVWNSIN
jgi:hypothetical protein